MKRMVMQMILEAREAWLVMQSIWRTELKV